MEELPSLPQIAKDIDCLRPRSGRAEPGQSGALPSGPSLSLFTFSLLPSSCPSPPSPLLQQGKFRCTEKVLS